MAPKTGWGRTSRECVHCRKPGPRVVVAGGYAHRRCITAAAAEPAMTERPDWANLPASTPPAVMRAAMRAERQRAT